MTYRSHNNVCIACFTFCVSRCFRIKLSFVFQTINFKLEVKRCFSDAQALHDFGKGSLSYLEFKYGKKERMKCKHFAFMTFSFEYLP